MPHNPSTPNFHNLILSGLDDHDSNLVRPHLKLVTLTFRQRLETPNKPIETAYFIETGLVSVVASCRPGTRQAEVGLIGFEGMTGLAVVTGATQSPNEAVMQSDGTAYSIQAVSLRSLIGRSSTLAQRFALYGFVFHLQTSNTVLVNAEGTIEHRLSRWLLMAQDRLKTDDLKLTHDTLSTMLGVRRPGVTIALRRLERLGLIATRRGNILILRRDGLVDYAEGFYGVPESEYHRLFTAR
ncbi:Crp/Fnr family transcriptional regulator [Asticcacaulis sp. AC466]|uniref:Crp/Fnr family transcriptional regulator n=1 Tax=Asticcacaulis sp. AC466 TaxID=1282362 RepID=UPI0004125587|nr:Crp/Fnr family transcriptional regulator [Asticcacaulis sp. AC466]